MTTAIAMPAGILNPVGHIEPNYLGQIFFDPVNELLYQSRGHSCHEWDLVTPKELVGSFVKIFDYFLGPIGTEPADPEQWNKDVDITLSTMGLDGVRIHRALYWNAASGDKVLMARVTIEKPAGLSVFIGFTSNPVHHAFPSGAGFIIRNHEMWFGDERIRNVEIGVPMAFRVERGESVAAGYIHDDMAAQAMGVDADPVIAVFNRRPGPRVVADGYDQLLKRRMARKQ